MGRHTRLSAAQPQARTTSLYGIICEGISFKRELMKRVDGRGFGLRKLLLILVASGCLCPYAIGQAQVQGQWTTLPYTMPINPVHVSLLNNGKVLVVSGSGNYTPTTNYQAAVWDPKAGTITTQPVDFDMFC